jgi:hypothetical protein
VIIGPAPKTTLRKVNCWNVANYGIVLSAKRFAAQHSRSLKKK